MALIHEHDRPTAIRRREVALLRLLRLIIAHVSGRSGEERGRRSSEKWRVSVTRALNLVRAAAI